jgi:apolipoprotein N-acyltransferase
MGKQSFWCTTLLSALAFNLAWLCEPWCAWLVLPSMLSLCFLKAKPRALFFPGFVWGLLVFGFHFHWLADALVRHFSAHLLVLAGIAVIIIYFSLLAGLLFVAMGLALKISWILGIVPQLCFFIGIDRWGLAPLGLGWGYPFFNPCIPLSCYSSFLYLLTLLMPSVQAPELVFNNFVYLQPVVNRAWGQGAAWSTSPHATALRLGRQLSVQQSDTSAIVVAPESAFLFPLNNYPELVGSVLSCAKKEGLIGALFEKDNLLHQAVYHLQKGLIINFYVKRLMVPFVEEVPAAWCWLKPWLQKLAPHYFFFTAGADDISASLFNLQGCIVRPMLCYEFFVQPLVAAERIDVVMAFVNDSWYRALFRRWLFLLATVKSHFFSVPVVYIGHYGCYTIASKK